MAHALIEHLRAHVLVVVAFALTGLCMAASQHINIPDISAFLDADKWNQISNHNTIHCKWTVHTSESVVKEEASFSMETIYEVLHAARVAPTNFTLAHMRNSPIRMMESHHPDSKILVPAVSPGGRSVSIADIPKHLHLSPEGMLCVEMLIANKHINVVVPFQETSEENYVHKHSAEALERFYRGAAFLVPPAETITIFHDKKLFADWMLSNNMSYLLPTVYKSKEEVVYPAVIKATTKTGGRGVVVVESLAELEAEIHHMNGSPYLIEEAITGKIEVCETWHRFQLFINHRYRQTLLLETALSWA